MSVVAAEDEHAKTFREPKQTTDSRHVLLSEELEEMQHIG